VSGGLFDVSRAPAISKSSKRAKPANWILSPATHGNTLLQCGALDTTCKENTMSDNLNPVIHNLRRLGARADATAEQMADFYRRQANGEKPNPNEFAALLQKFSVTNSAMAAQFKLYEKPLKTALQEAK
jgi:hypothetical protein